MRVRGRLLAGAAVVSVATMSLPAAAGAATVQPGGALDITLTGFARFLGIGGDRDSFLLDRTQSTALDFFNDTEVHILARGRHDATGIEYGGTIELEADTDQTANTDETWLFLRGSFGEVRLGDEDGIADADGMAVGAERISKGIGTDGIEGDQWEEFAGSYKTYEAVGTSDATKIRYKTPSFAGFALGVSYTPNLEGIGSGSSNGGALATKDAEADNVVEGAVAYEGEALGVDLEVGLSGLVGDVNNEDELGGDDFWQWQAGAVVGLGDFKLGGSFLRQKIGALEYDAISAGLSYDFGPLLLALTYGQFIDSDNLAVNDVALDQPRLAILSGTVPLMPGVTLDGDVGYFDNEIDGDAPVDGDGWQAIGRLGLAF